MNGLIVLVVSAGSMLASQAVWPQAAEAPKTFIQMIEAQCPSMTAKLANAPILKDALANRELDRAQVCSCAASKLRANSRLAPYLDVTAVELRAKLANRQQGSVLMTYAMSAIIGCIAPQLDAALDAVPLE